MNTVEDRVRAALDDLVDDAQPAAFLHRLEARRAAQPRVARRRLALGAVAAAVVVLLVAAMALRAPQNRPIVPAEQPPKILRLSADGTLSPGRTLLAVTLAADSENDNTSAYLLADGTADAVLLPTTDRTSGSWTQHLSADGTSFVRQHWEAGAGFEIVDLRTGEVDDFGGMLAYCPTLSPDGRLLAAQLHDGDVGLIDRDTGSALRIADEGTSCGYMSFGWAPDGNRLVIRTRAGSEVRDRQGTLLDEIHGLSLVNGSMSWSPDGRDLLMYRPSVGTFAIVAAAGGSVARLPQPGPGARPLGWTGDRVVWLVGSAGRQRLVTTDRHGGDRQLWMHLDIGGRVVDNITWSRALTGRG